MAPTRVGVTGATGRMGEELLRAAADRPDVAVAFAVSRSPEAVPAAVGAGPGGSDVEVAADADLPSLLSANGVDAVVDFTVPVATADYAAACAEAGVPLVTGTTGLDADAEAALDAAAESTPVLHASNFSRGVAALRQAIGTVTGALPGYDVEVTETHHNGKRDAPSGTATSLLEDVEAARPDLTERVHGREGEAPRDDAEIGVHARRAGDVTGDHEVLFAGNRETLSLSHRAGDRGVFAEGALDAAGWVAGRDAGRYEFREVLE